MYRSNTVMHNGTRWRIDEADTFGDVLDWLDSTPAEWSWSNRNSQLSNNERLKFTGTYTYQEASELARFGWPKGRKEMQRGLDTANVIRHGSRHKSEGLDVAGDYPVVPVAIAGDPMCMVTRGQEHIRTKPVVRIIVNHGWSASISRSVIINRGAAILSWVDALEEQGVRCEIYSTWLGVSGDMAHSFGFYAKRAEEHLSIDRMAFTLAHPAILRRIMFNVMEHHGDMESKFKDSYGWPSDLIPPTLDMPHSVYFGALKGWEADWQSPALAVAAVERAILKSLQHSEVEEDLRSMED